jgi:hypothetical protein
MMTKSYQLGWPMRYRCVHCDLGFETEDEVPRCPRCLRKSGVEVVSTGAAALARGARPRSPVWLIAGLVLALAELGGFLYGTLEPPAGIAGAAMMAGCLLWATVATWMVVVGLRGVLARMK